MKYQFVDCRWELGKPDRGRDLYLGGHIPGASFLDVDSDLSSPAGARGRHPLPDPEKFARAAGQAGIGDGVFVVAYGNMGGAEALSDSVHGRPFSLRLTLPPLGAVFLKKT